MKPGKTGTMTPPSKPDNGVFSSGAGPALPPRNDGTELVSVDLGSEGEINNYTASLRAGNIDRFFELAAELHTTLHAEKMIKDRRYHLKVYKQCLKGNDLVDWFVKRGQTTSRVEAVAVGCSLLEHGFLHHVCDDHHFKDEGMYYRFRRDEDSGIAAQQQEKPYREAAQLAVRIQSYLASLEPHLIQSREYGLRSFKNCFVASHFVQWAVAHGLVANKQAAIDLGCQLQAYGFVNHVCDDHQFTDGYLFFRFYVDGQ